VAAAPAVTHAPAEGVTLFLWLRDFAGEPHEYTKTFEKTLTLKLNEAGYHVTFDKRTAVQFQAWATVFVDPGKRAFAEVDLYDAKGAKRLDSARYEEPATGDIDRELLPRLAAGLVNKLNASNALADAAKRKKR
jgi:hypothetical protein